MVSCKNVEDWAQLKDTLANVREANVVRVKSPDRLSRSTRVLLDLFEHMREKGVEIEFVDNPAQNTNVRMARSC